MSAIRRLAILLGAALLCVSTASHADYTSLKLDRTHSRMGFTASTLLFDVRGRFKKYDIQLDGSLQKPEQSRVEVTIDAASIFTDNEKRDEHLRSSDFFHVDEYPEITFTSSKVVETRSGLKITGTLDMHGKRKQVTVPFDVKRGKNGAGKEVISYKGELTLDRTEFGIGNESVAAKISLEDEVTISPTIVVFR